MIKKLGLILCWGLPVLANAASLSCGGNDASSLTGVVVQAPSFQTGQWQSGIRLSHSVFYLQASDQQVYQVAVDNVFTSDYDSSHGQSVPLSLQSALVVGAAVQLCGEVYDSATLGIHWVHTNCGNDSVGPTGYVVVGGQNLTANTEYCWLWPQHSTN